MEIITISEAYSNLNRLIAELENENGKKEFIDSIIAAQKALLAIEMMGIVADSKA